MPVCRPRSSRVQSQVGPGARASLRRACLLTLLVALSVLSTGMPGRAKQRSTAPTGTDSGSPTGTDSGAGRLGQGPRLGQAPSRSESDQNAGPGNRWRCPGCTHLFYSLLGLNQHRGSQANESTPCFSNTSDGPMLAWRSLRQGASHGSRARSMPFASGPDRSRSISPDPGDDMGRAPSQDSMDEAAGGNGRAGAAREPQVSLCIHYVCVIDELCTHYVL